MRYIIIILVKHIIQIEKKVKQMKNLMNVLKVTNFVKENNLKLIADNGITITDSIGYVMFDDSNVTKCFENAARWIDNRK